ncbi:MAG TPA: FkbM family methyltransferase [Xanthobacteraceae bacterium]|jgi:FkbM family methyltransferase|nr:FkbM family methyltransferase [Xanthobacteraceae bacterium]
MRSIFPQEMESRLKLAFFAGANPGYFVEVGANQPRELSQTFDLEQQGWTGLLVEPQPGLADALSRQRSARVYAVACSSKRNAGSSMTLHLAGPHSSFDQNLNLVTVRPHATIEVPVRTLDEILIEARAPQIDFMSIDVEGHELDVLDGLNLARWSPRLILIEDLLLHLQLHRYLVRNGYRWMRRTGINNWYVPAAMPAKLGYDGRWQFFNKHYLGTPFRRLRAAWRRARSRPQPIGR